MEQKDKKIILDRIDSININMNNYKELHATIFDEISEKKTTRREAREIANTAGANILYSIRKLFEESAERWNLEINEGAILNISVVLFNFIRNSGITLKYDEERDKIVGLSQNSGEFSISKIEEGLLIEIISVGKGSAFYPETAIVAILNGDAMTGRAQVFEKNCPYNYKIEFKKNGLLDKIEYDRQVFLSREWPKNWEPILNTEIKYGKERSQKKDTLYQCIKTIDTHKYPDERYLDALNRLIDEVPGVIDVWHQQFLEQQVHQVIGVDNEIIKTVFPKLWNRADTTEYKTARARTRKIMNEQKSSF